ncbi:hypothetical protein AI2762V1_3393 [Enterobacter cloacae]|nr:hypothetical protein AI2762V1_3393 [Enterobacter cloacae]CAH3815971.1 hypothetical protein AI2762V1_3393 [Enterobacter cloacae]
MSHLTTCEDSHSATSSPELASGLIPCASQDGLTINQSGPVPVRASLSARQAKEMGLLTSGIFGPTSSTSSASAALSMSLANRLQAVTQTHGSTLYKLTWKEWNTPSGLCRLRQRASARHTSENELIGWPTPVVGDMTGGPRPPDKKRGPAPGMQSATALTGWPTPTTESAMREKRYAQGGMPFSMAAALTSWVTPTSRDWKDSAGMTAQRDGKERLDQLPRQAYTCGPLRLTVFGEMRTGYFVEMANGVQLNPAHSRWLMGLPRAWDESSPGWHEWQAATASADSKAMGTP